MTCTWTAQQRDADTARVWAAIRGALHGAGSLLDYGCGLGRFAPHAKAAGLRYLGADILPDSAADCHSFGVAFHLINGGPIPPEIDCDAAIFVDVIQHFDDAEARHALDATRAKTLIIIDGAQKSDSYTVAREFPAYELLLKDCGCGGWEVKAITTPLVCYKMIVGIRA